LDPLLSSQFARAQSIARFAQSFSEDSHAARGIASKIASLEALGADESESGASRSSALREAEQLRAVSTSARRMAALHSNLVVVSICGGYRDEMVHASICDAQASGSWPVQPRSHGASPGRLYGFSALTSQMVGASNVSADHQAILWCNQVARAVAKAIVAVASSTAAVEDPAERERVLARSMLADPDATLSGSLENLADVDEASHSRSIAEALGTLAPWLPLRAVTVVADLLAFLARLVLEHASLIIASAVSACMLAFAALLGTDGAIGSVHPALLVADAALCSPLRLVSGGLADLRELVLMIGGPAVHRRHRRLVGSLLVVLAASLLGWQVLLGARIERMTPELTQRVLASSSAAATIAAAGDWLLPVASRIGLSLISLPTPAAALLWCGA
jgi:hypothetical protein